MREKRKSLRLENWDYSTDGAYYVTVCTQNRQQVLSQFCGSKLEVLPVGQIVVETLQALPQQYDVSIDAYVIMPDHIHIMFVLGGGRGGVLPRPPSALPAIVGGLKSVSTKEANRNYGQKGQKLWQRGYYETIIRSDAHYHDILRYMQGNPMRWLEKREG